MTPPLPWLLALSFCVLMFASMTSGAGAPGGAELLALISGAAGDEAAMVLIELRLPRMLGALLVGSALGAAGMLMQAATGNPLAEPGLLGVNSGAALGVVAGIAWAGAAAGPGYLLWAVLGALAGNAAVLAVANARRQAGPLRLVLAGIALGATFHGASSAILLSAPSGYDQYRFWVLGSLAGITPAMLAWTAGPVLAALLAAVVLAQPLSALLVGDDSARSLGRNPAPLRAGVALCATVLTGSAVALAVSLRHQVGMSAALGAALLLLADLGARLVAQPFETPASVLTALLGAPLVVWLARRRPA